MDIHNYKARFERTLQRIKEADDISKENKESLFKFKDYGLSEGIGLAKLERYLYDLMKYARMLKIPFESATKAHVRAVVAELEQTDLSAETKLCFKIAIRRLHRFIRGIEEKGVYPEEVKWISTHLTEVHHKLPEELLTEDETLAIIRHTTNIRDRALLAVLAESGCRIGEIGSMSIKHVSFEEHGARLTVAGKTGMRKILVIQSAPFMQEWINMHPDNTNPDANLWISSKGQPITYTRIVCILKTSAKNAGIKKRVYPHLLRHSRATNYASKMSEASMKHYFGWTQSSRMVGRYIHMSGKATDDAIFAINGIQPEKEKVKQELQPRKCERCKTTNPSTHKFCKLCGFPLDKEEAEKLLTKDSQKMPINNLMNNIMNDPEVLEFIKKKLEAQIA